MLHPIQSLDITTRPDSKTFFWNQYSPRTATITAQDFNTVCYFAFSSHSEAKAFWDSIIGKHCTRAKIRYAERFDGFRYEVKVWQMKLEVFEKLVRRDRERAEIEYLETRWLEQRYAA